MIFLACYICAFYNAIELDLWKRGRRDASHISTEKSLRTFSASIICQTVWNLRALGLIGVYTRKSLCLCQLFYWLGFIWCFCQFLNWTFKLFCFKIRSDGATQHCRKMTDWFSDDGGRYHQHLGYFSELKSLILHANSERERDQQRQKTVDLTFHNWHWW